MMMVGQPKRWLRCLLLGAECKCVLSWCRPSRWSIRIVMASSTLRTWRTCIPTWVRQCCLFCHIHYAACHIHYADRQKDVFQLGWDTTLYLHTDTRQTGKKTCIPTWVRHHPLSSYRHQTDRQKDMYSNLGETTPFLLLHTPFIFV